jgi:hypothetical protein
VIYGLSRYNKLLAATERAMEIEAAYATLGLTATATAKEVKDKFRKLAVSTHPDRGGSDDLMAKLIDARDRVLEEIPQSSALLPISVVAAIVATTIAKSSAADTIKQQVRDAKLEIRDISTSRLKNRLTRAGIWAAVSAGAIFLGGEVPDAFFSLGSALNFPLSLQDQTGEIQIALLEANKKQMQAIWSMSFFIIAVYSGISAWFSTIRVERVESRLKELEENISNKPLCFSLLKELLQERIENDWTTQQLSEAFEDGHSKLGDWGELVQEVGSLKLAILITNTALQLGLLEVSEHFDEGEFIQRYAISGG